MTNPNRFRAGKSVSTSREGRSRRAGTGQVHSRRIGSDLNPPTGFSSIVAETSVSVSFTAPAGDTPTNILYALSTNGGSTYGAFTALSPADAVSPITISGLTSNQAYVVKFKSFMDGEESGESATHSFQTLAAAPTGLSTSGVTTTSVVVSFTQPTGGGATVSNYKYALSTNGGASYGPYVALSPADGASPITISGLASSTAYSVKIQAVTAAGDGTESAATSFTTPQPAPTSVEYLIVAGGGGGGHCNSNDNRNGGGGGGAGGYRTGTVAVTPGAAYAVVIGGGGSRGAGPQGFNGAVGGSSSVFSITSNGGGGGAHDEGGSGGSGGSGGGGSATAVAAGGGPGSGTAGQGNAGGAGNSGGGGGGGGAGAAGSSRAAGGTGGVGLNWNSLGTFYAGGGGGGSRGGGQAAGGNGGGGSGSNSGNGFNATAHTGGGGGGGGNSDNNNHEGGHGGSGIVIIRWSTSFAPATLTSASGGSVTYNNGAGGFHMYTFRASGSIGVNNSGSITI